MLNTRVNKSARESGRFCFSFVLGYSGKEEGVEIEVLFLQLHPEFIGPPKRDVQIAICGLGAGGLVTLRVMEAEAQAHEDTCRLMLSVTEPALELMLLTQRETGSIAHLVASMFSPVPNVYLMPEIENLPRAQLRRSELPISRSASMLRMYNISKRHKSGKWR